jgi:membrane protein implicated in regulation of membrane protease activity
VWVVIFLAWLGLVVVLVWLSLLVVLVQGRMFVIFSVSLVCLLKTGGERYVLQNESYQHEITTAPSFPNMPGRRYKDVCR